MLNQVSYHPLTMSLTAINGTVDSEHPKISAAAKGSALPIQCNTEENPFFIVQQQEKYICKDI